MSTTDIRVSGFRFGERGDDAEFVVVVKAESKGRVLSSVGYLGSVNGSFEVGVSPRRRSGSRRELKHPTEVGKLEELALKGVASFCRDLLSKLTPGK